ncbi:MAG: hypothetical protein E6R04_11545 [Spirochaetes bacterium]|nr:MAG: hypothetical protein E6R04_11545 [Spirochaetota bacterium]
MTFLNDRVKTFFRFNPRHQYAANLLTELYEMGAFESDPEAISRDQYGFFENGARAYLQEGKGPGRIFLGQRELFEIFGSRYSQKSFRIKYGSALYSVHRSDLLQLHVFEVTQAPRRQPGVLYRPNDHYCRAVNAEGKTVLVPRDGVLFFIKDVVLVSDCQWFDEGIVKVTLHYEMLYGEQKLYVNPEEVEPLHEDQT